MTKQILILHRVEDRETYDNADKLAAQLNEAQTGAQFVPATYESLVFAFTNNTLRVTVGADGPDIASFAAIGQFGWFKTKLLEDLAHSVAIYAEHHRVPCLNSEALHERSKTKLSQYVAAACGGVSMVPFLFSCETTGIEHYSNDSAFSGELIVKAINGNRGNDNYKVAGIAEAQAIIDQNPEILFVLQQFVPNNGDLRVIVLGGEVKIIIGRQAVGDTHLSNTSKGGQAVIVPKEDVSSELLTDAIKMAQLLRREISGIDMIVDTNSGKHYLLEANNMPQLATGAFTAEKTAVLAAYFDSL